MEPQCRMTETSQQLLEASVLDFRALFNPNKADIIDGLQLAWLIEAAEQNLAPVQEAHLHRGVCKADLPL